MPTTPVRSRRCRRRPDGRRAAVGSDRQEAAIPAVAHMLNRTVVKGDGLCRRAKLEGTRLVVADDILCEEVVAGAVTPGLEC